MRKKVFLTLICIVKIAMITIAQKASNDNLDNSWDRKRFTSNVNKNIKIDTSKSNSGIIDDKAFINVVKNDLSFLTTGNGNSNLYNQIFLDVIEPKIQVNVQAFEIFNKTTIKNKKGEKIYLDKDDNETTSRSERVKNKKEERTPIIRINLGVVAGVKNNISSLFSNDKINPNVGINGQINFDIARILGLKYGYYFLPDYKKKFKLKEQNFQRNLNLQLELIKDRILLNTNDTLLIIKKINSIELITDNNIEVVQKNGTLFCIKNAENGSKENQENAHTLRA